jgi:hypothetical protein
VENQRQQPHKQCAKHGKSHHAAQECGEAVIAPLSFHESPLGISLQWGTDIVRIRSAGWAGIDVRGKDKDPNRRSGSMAPGGIMIAVAVVPFLIVGVLASIGVVIAVVVMTIGAAVVNPRFGLVLLGFLGLCYWFWCWVSG